MTEIEKKVNELRDFIETHYTEKDEYPKYLYDILEDFIDMEKENKELRKSIKSWNENGGNLLKENIKLKKVIEFLVKVFHFKVEKLTTLNSESEYYLYWQDKFSSYGDPITQELYELLKEVLGNEKIFNSKKEK